MGLEWATLLCYKHTLPDDDDEEDDAVFAAGGLKSLLLRPVRGPTVQTGASREVWYQLLVLCWHVITLASVSLKSTRAGWCEGGGLRFGSPWNSRDSVSGSLLTHLRGAISGALIHENISKLHLYHLENEGDSERISPPWWGREADPPQAFVLCWRKVQEYQRH